MPANTTIVIKDGTYGIPESAFYGQTGLVRVILPDGLYSIDSWAFENCSELKSIYMPKSIKKFGYQMFNGCNDLTIYGEKDSSVENYANIYKFNFSTEPLSEENVSYISASAIDIGAM